MDPTSSPHHRVRLRAAEPQPLPPCSLLLPDEWEKLPVPPRLQPMLNPLAGVPPGCTASLSKGPRRRQKLSGLLPAECGLCSQPIDFFPPCLLWVYYCHYINYAVRSSGLCQGQPMAISSFIHLLGCPMSTASAHDVPTGKTTSCDD